MDRKYAGTIIFKVTGAQKEHLEDLAAATSLSMSDIIRLALTPLTPPLVHELKIQDLNRQVEEIKRANEGKPMDLQARLPGMPVRKRKYRKTGKYKGRYRMLREKEKASVCTTGLRENEVGSLQPFNSTR